MRSSSQAVGIGLIDEARIVLADVHWITTALRDEFRSSSNRMRRRRCGLLRLESIDGDVGWGEFAPWPEPSESDIGALNRCARAIAAGASAGDVSTQFLARNSPHDGAALSSAIDTAASDLCARQRMTPMFPIVQSTIAVNAVLDIGSGSERAIDYVERGFDTIKCKIGAHHIQETIRRLRTIRAVVGPDIELRLDANGAWDRCEAANAVKQLAIVEPELLEQPLPPGDFEGMAELRKIADFPIIADESIVDLHSLELCMGLGAADGVMIKVSRVGGPTQAIDLARRAYSEGLTVLFSSMFEFGIGLSAGIAACAAGPWPGPHGFATSEFLAHDVADVGGVHDGVIDVPRGAGLGIRPDLAAVAQLEQCE